MHETKPIPARLRPEVPLAARLCALPVAVHSGHQHRGGKDHGGGGEPSPGPKIVLCPASRVYLGVGHLGELPAINLSRAVVRQTAWLSQTWPGTTRESGTCPTGGSRALVHASPSRGACVRRTIQWVIAPCSSLAGTGAISASFLRVPRRLRTVLAESPVSFAILASKRSDSCSPSFSRMSRIRLRAAVLRDGSLPPAAVAEHRLDVLR